MTPPTRQGLDRKLPVLVRETVRDVPVDVTNRLVRVEEDVELGVRDRPLSPLGSGVQRRDPIRQPVLAEEVVGVEECDAAGRSGILRHRLDSERREERQRHGAERATGSFTRSSGSNSGAFGIFVPNKFSQAGTYALKGVKTSLSRSRRSSAWKTTTVVALAEPEDLVESSGLRDASVITSRVSVHGVDARGIPVPVRREAAFHLDESHARITCCTSE
jgi:hypothetical protein